MTPERPAGFRLDGRAVVVAGASRGIGAAAAVACAQAGAASVDLLARSVEALEETAEAVERAGAHARPRACDVTSTASIAEAFEAIPAVDVLVNSAGGNAPMPFEEVDQAAFDELLALNVRGAFFLAQAGARLMRRGGIGGTIVTVSSQMGHVGAVNRSVYCTTKHAVEGMTKALALELAPFGIRVVTVAPTFVRTAMTAAQLDDPEIGPALLAQIPARRLCTVEEVAAAIVYAASPAAASMTGSSLLLDGGWTAQ